MTRVNIIFSMDSILLPDEAQDAIRDLTAEWVIVSVVDTRQLIDAIVDPDHIPTIQAMLADQNPVIIGAWTEDGAQCVDGLTMNGTAKYLFNATELAVFGGTFTHGFAGWAERQT